jgi:Fe2+ transport system protein FeoA
MGLIAGTRFTVIQNVKSLPVLIAARDTVIALNQKEAAKIIVEEGI